MPRKELIAYIRKSNPFFSRVNLRGRSMKDLISIKTNIEHRKEVLKQHTPKKGH